MTDLVFKSVLICNDIRRETTGKYIAIGIYGPDIVIPHEVASVQLACLLQIEAKVPGSFRLELRGRDSRQRDLVTARGEFRTSFAAKNLLLDLNVGPATVRAGTEIEFSAREKGGRWKRLSSLAVRGPNEQAALQEEIRAFVEKNSAAPINED